MLAVPCLAATPGAAEGLDLRFQRLGPEDGLAQGSVFSLLQDRHGFVWIGTQDGLHRYDGYRFEIYKPDPFRLDGLSHGLVEHLLEDAEGRLWVGTYRGLDRLDATGRHFEHPLADGERSAIGQAITSLAADGAGGVWVAQASGGLVRVPATGDSGPLNVSNGALPSGEVTALHRDAAGRVWVGFADAAPGWLDADGQFIHLPTDVASRLPDAPVRAVVDDRPGRHGISTDGAGLVRLDGLDRLDDPSARFDVRRFVHDPADPGSLGGDQVAALLVDSDGRLWVGTSAAGISVWSDATGRFDHIRHRPADPASLVHDSVRALFEDASGLIWAGSVHGGLTLIDTRPRFGLERADPDDPTSLPSNVVRAFLDDSRGRLWVGTDGGGLVIRDADGRFRPVAAVAERRIWSLFEDRDGAIWAGGHEALYQLDADTAEASAVFRPDLADLESLGDGGVRGIGQDPAGRLWIAHFGGGVSRLDPGERRFERFTADEDRAFSLPSDYALGILVDRRGQVWIGTTEGLARRSADGRFHAYRHDPDDRSSLVGDIVRSMYQDAAGHLWVGTDAGLNRLPANRVESPPTSAPNQHGFTHFTTAQGLPDTTVYAVLGDETGHLWISTNRGLARLDPGDGSVDAFDLEDGLQGYEYNGAAAWRGDDGMLYFGGVQGYNHFRPEAIGINPYVPPVTITRVETIDGPLETDRPVWALDHLVLPYDEPAVTFEFAALDYTHSSANRYAYRLGGVDREDEWHELGTQNVLTLPLRGLGDGEFTLHVRGSNNDGIWNQDGASLRFTVQPPWWAAPRARLLYAAFALLLASIVGFQMRRRRLAQRRVDEQIRISERRLELALLGSGDGLWDWDLRSDEIYRSHVAEMLGYLPGELPSGRDFRIQLVHPEDLSKLEWALDACQTGELERVDMEYRVRDQWGRWRWVLDRGNVVERDRDGRPVRLAGTFKDMTALKETEAKLRLWSAVFEAVDEGVLLVDTGGRIRAANRAFCTMIARPHDDLIDRSIQVLGHDDALFEEIRETLLAKGEWDGEIEQRRLDVEAEADDASSFLAAVDVHAVRDGGSPTDDDRGEIRHYVVVVDDITERKRAEEELRFLADNDVLTGLPNRSCFLRHLDEALDRSRADIEDGETGPRVALLFGDLDQFKQINDTLGHAFGDLLLQQAAERLLGSVRGGDLVARLGGDEFTVLIENVDDRLRVVRVAERILRSFSNPFHLEGHEVSSSTSLGIALFPEDGEDAETLLKHADTAMYEAKAQGRSRFRFYTHEMGERALQRLTLDNRLRRALQEDALDLHYQPQLDLDTGTVVGVEALVRWPQADGAVLPPSAFLSVAEETGLIVPLGRWVLERACRQAAAWASDGLDLRMAVNLSASQLAEDDLV
ncbi:MAG: two-component regulator propeller domain-containing protein, partial [Acidobacteriota bacterium]